IADLMPEVRDHDPQLALAGGPDGLQAYRELFSAARDLLADGGLLIVEIGESQAKDVRAVALDSECLCAPEQCEEITDLAGRPRVLAMAV
ncbi:MAG: protein-(glutamine-N5) methyltransferase, release factor-specific, partial [Pseudomonadota bacterium]